MSIPYRIYDIMRDVYQENFVYTKLQAPQQDLSGQVILVTGANAGLGKESVRQLALMRPAKIIMTARNMTKGEEAREELIKSTGFKQIQLERLDLCSMESVNALSKKILKSEKRLDVLMCNAGLGGLAEHARKTADGFDEMFQGNNLGHYLFTVNLLSLIESSSSPSHPSRIIYLSSLASKAAFSFDMNSYSNTKKLSANAYYPISKLMASLMAKGVAQREKGRGVVAHSCHPGTVRTEFADKYPAFLKDYLFPVVYAFMGRPLDQGAATQVYLASAPECAKTTGEYWSNMIINPGNPTLQNEQLCRQFVELCDELVSKYKL